MASLTGVWYPRDVSPLAQAWKSSTKVEAPEKDNFLKFTYARIPNSPNNERLSYDNFSLGSW